MSIPFTTSTAGVTATVPDATARELGVFVVATGARGFPDARFTRIVLGAAAADAGGRPLAGE